MCVGKNSFVFYMMMNNTDLTRAALRTALRAAFVTCSVQGLILWPQWQS